MKYKVLTKIFSLFFAILFVLPLCLFSVSAADAVPTFEDINETDVVSDLKRIGIDITMYQKDVAAEHCRVLTFLEYGYDYYSQSTDYGLYVYVWNPTGRAINTTRGMNSIELQLSPTSNVDRDGLGFLKYKLEFCNYSTVQGYEHVFYKFKIADAKSFVKKLNRDLRTYDISGIELQHVGDSKPTDYAVGGVYSFDGYMPYHNKNHSIINTLNVSVKDRLTLFVEMHPTSWKSKTSDKGLGYQYEMFSVYFSIPNDVIRDYGDMENKENKGLVSIAGDYNAHKINGIVTDDYLLDLTVKNNLGYVGEYNENVPFNFYSSKALVQTGGFSLHTWYENPFNIGTVKSGNIALIPHVWDQGSRANMFIDRVNSSILYEDDFKSISLNNLCDQLNSVWDFYGFSCNCDSHNSLNYFSNYGDNVSYLVEAGEDLTDQIATFASKNKKSFFGWLNGTNKLVIEDEVYDNAMSIQAISLSDILVSGTEDVLKESDVISDKYFIDFSETQDFCNFVLDESLDFRTTYLMRFAVEDYYITPIVITETNFDEVYEDGEYYFEKTIYQDIDIFSFTFQNIYSQRCTIPVVASPIDNVGTITPTDPGVSDNDKGGNSPKWPDLSIIGKLLALIAFLLIIALVVLLISKIFGLPATWLFTSFAKVIVWILSLPFKLFSWIFNSIKTLGGAPLKSSDCNKKDKNKKE